jgi:hypothetical protein
MSVDAYPAGPYGLDALKIIDNFAFMGFRDGGDPFTELDLNDFYDPDGAKNIKALFITLGWNGCPASVRLATRMNTWDTQYRSQGSSSREGPSRFGDRPGRGQCRTFRMGRSRRDKWWIKYLAAGADGRRR